MCPTSDRVLGEACGCWSVCRAIKRGFAEAARVWLDIRQVAGVLKGFFRMPNGHVAAHIQPLQELGEMETKADVLSCLLPKPAGYAYPYMGRKQVVSCCSTSATTALLVWAGLIDCSE